MKICEDVVVAGRFCGRDEQDVKPEGLNSLRGGYFSERQTFRRKLRVRERARDWRGLVVCGMERRDGDSRSRRTEVEWNKAPER